MKITKEATKKLIEKLRQKKKFIIIAISVTALLAILVAVYVALGMYFKTHFWFRTEINGVNCSRKTVAETQDIITERTEGYRLVLVEDGEQIGVINGDDVGMQLEFDEGMHEALQNRNAFAWPVSLLRKTSLKFKTMITYDEEKLQAVMENMTCLQPTDRKAAENAYISGYIKGKRPSDR